MPPMIGPTTGRIHPATAPIAAPASTGLVEGCFIPCEAIALISAVASGISWWSWWRGSFGSSVDMAEFLFLGPCSVRIDGKGGAKLADAGAHAFLDLSIAFRAVLGKPATHFCDQRPDGAELFSPEAARGACGGAEANAAGDEGTARVEREDRKRVV